jgi:hypothetical protein
MDFPTFCESYDERHAAGRHYNEARKTVWLFRARRPQSTMLIPSRYLRKRLVSELLNHGYISSRCRLGSRIA